MSNHQEQLGWLAAIRELKAEFYIGSYPAFKYLKTVNWLEQVRQQIIENNPGLQQKHDLTIHRIAQLIDMTRMFLANVLERSSVAVSTPEHCSLGSSHTIDAPVSFSRHDCHDYDVDEDGYVWSIDFTHFLIGFHTVLPPEMSNKMLVKRLYQWTAHSWCRNALQLRLVKTGEQVSYSQFCVNADYRASDLNGLWGSVGWYLDFGHDTSENPLTDNELAVLRQGFRRKDIATVHPVLQHILMRELKDGARMNMSNAKFILNNDTHPEEDWLYESRLYERAEREYTLGYMEIERRIVLNVIRNLYQKPEDYESVDAFVNNLIDYWRNYVQECRRLMAELTKLEAPGCVIDNQARMLQERRYIYVALQQNRRWLREFLSR